MSKLEDFGGMQEVADEYSDVKECLLSDVGYHCSCYDRGHKCDICGKMPVISSLEVVDKPGIKEKMETT